MKSLSTLFLFAALINEALSQDTTRSYNWELSGTISYSYSNQSDEESRYYASDFLQYYHTHQWSVQPSIGYFIAHSFEVMTDLRYTYRFQEFNTPQQGILSQWSDNVGFSVGPSYNHFVTSSTCFFLAVKVGLGWTRYGYTNFGRFPDSGWKKAEISFPIVEAGTKIFLSDLWALILQGQYIHTSNFNGDDNTIMSTVSGGVGVSVFF